MIPQRIALRGFLSYREEQEILLDSASLWLLAGPNGSGKSAVFDAITYTLFGGHRGGQTGAQGLINKDSNNMTVEFDFLLDDKFYQARRTLHINDKGKTTATQQIRRWVVPADGSGRWETVPDTGSRAGFDAWVRENIGLTYETFTSSVLLMQGKAEKLLSAAPKERFEVLAGIMDLARYQALHKRADDRRRAAELKAETLRQRLNAMPEVNDSEIAAATAHEANACAAWQRVQDELATLQRLELHAIRWSELQAHGVEVEQRWQRCQTLLADAAAIERDVARLHELQRVLPQLEAGRVQQERLREAEHTATRLGEERQRLSDQLAALEKAFEQVECKRHLQEQEQLAEAERGQALTVELQGLSVALVHLRRLHRERGSLLEAHRQADQAGNQERAHAATLQQRQIEFDAVSREWEAARRAREDADRRLTQMRTLLEAIQDRRSRFFSVAGEKTCRYCGQLLTEAHVEEERVKLEGEVAAADTGFREAEEFQQQAVAVELRNAQASRSAETQFQELRQRHSEAQRHLDVASRDLSRFTQECERAYRELADPYRTRVSPTAPGIWSATCYPTDADLAELQERQARWESEIQALSAARESRRNAIADAAAEWARLNGNRCGLHAQQNDCERQLAEAKTAAAVSEETLLHIARQLPESWHGRLTGSTLATDLRAWQAERTSLAQSGVENRAAELHGARTLLESLQVRKQDLDRQREDIPAEARCDPAAVRERLRAAKDEEKKRGQERIVAQQARLQLQDLQKQRQQLDAECRKADRQEQLHDVLAKLLGRDRLQLHLVRQAEHSIVDHTNAVLDRISGGQLYLRLQPGEDGESADHALQLQAFNRSTGSEPINVAFLSGSQRFRVAVSLALGIGQYASRTHRPIESVIIDEGFGCLDRQGRQVMIQELHNLRDHLRCILVVSHQEEFEAAFADGYHFDLVDGSTIATRFQN
jgi:DNA repair exonuclease SbcCD ATPase subunit